MPLAEKQGIQEHLVTTLESVQEMAQRVTPLKVFEGIVLCIVLLIWMCIVPKLGGTTVSYYRPDIPM
ncbi:MAG: hypothetical protein PUE67_01925 [Oscillospiraceae bacterium]|nr:hypothetical protein [Oscillospiraceae bacterium]